MRLRGHRRRTAPLIYSVRIAAACAFVALAVICGVSVRTLLMRASQHLDLYVVQALQSVLHREVRVSRFEVSRPGVIHIQGLTIAGGKTFRSGELMAVPEARVEFRLMDLILGRIDPLGSIQRVSIERPRLLIIRQANNRFNLQDLFPPRKKPPQPSKFRGQVTLHGGTVRFVDYAVRDLTAPQSNVLTVDSAFLDASGPPLMLLSATAHGDGRYMGRAAGAGNINTGAGAFTFRVRAEARQAPYWLRYFARINSLSLTSGSGTATIDVWKPRQKARTAAVIIVDAAGVSGTTKFTRAPLTNVSGSIRIATGRPLSTEINLIGDAAGMPISARGTIFSGPTGRVALDVAASGVTLPGLRRAVAGAPNLTWLTPLRPGAFQGKVYGAPTDLTIVGSAQVSRLKLYTAVLSDVAAKVEYRKGVLYLPSISGTSGGGRVTASGKIDMRTKAIDFIAGGPGLPIRNLAPRTLPLTGIVSTRALITGTTQAPRAGVVVTAVNGRFRNIPYRWLTAKLRYEGRRIEVLSAAAALPGATVSAKGSVTLAGALDLRTRAYGIQLGTLLPAMGYRNITGTGFFDGTVGGTTTSPRVQGRAQILNAQAGKQRLDLAAGDITWNRGVFTVRRASVARYPAQGTVHGTATLRPNGQVALNFAARLQTGRLEHLLKDAGVTNLEAEGDVRTTQDVYVRGTAASPVITGSAVITDAVIAGYPVDSASASFLYSKGLIAATGVQAESSALTSGETTVVRAPVLRLRNDKLEAPEGFSVTGVRLDRLGAFGAPYVKVTGVVDVTDGTLSGTLQKPLASARARIRNLTINGMGFDRAEGTVGYNGASVTVSDAVLGREARTVLSLSGLALNRETHAIAGDLKLNMPYAEVTKLLAGSDWYFSSAAAGLRDALDRLATQPEASMVTLGGPPEKPDNPLHFAVSRDNSSVNGTLAVSNLSLAEKPLTRVALGGRASGLRMGKEGLEAGSFDIPPGGLMAVSDTVDVKGQLSGAIGGAVTASLEALNVPLDYLTVVVPSVKNKAYEPHGEVSTFSVKASGRMGAPDVTASLRARKITVGRWQAPFDVSTGEVTVTNTEKSSMIEAKNVTLLMRNHRVTAFGSVPFSWKTMSVPPDQRIHATIQAGEQNLDILELAFGQAQGPVERAKGTVQAALTVNGTLAEPKWVGNLSVRDGSIKVRPLVSTLEKINADVLFDPVSSRASVEDLSLSSSTGGSVQGKGTLSLRRVTDPLTGEQSVTIDPDLRVDVKGLNIDEAPNGFGLGNERFRGTLDTAVNAPLRITPGNQGPLVAGTVTLSDVNLFPPNQTEPAIAEQAPPSFVPAFDLTLVAGKNVRVGNALYQIRVDERQPVTSRRLRITGDRIQPVIDGQFVSHDGVFNYPTARFRLTDAVIGVHYPPVLSFPGVSGRTSPDLAQLSEETSPLSVTANAQARLVATVNGRQQPVTVYMHIDGPVSSTPATVSTGAFQTLAPYRITLRSSPSLPQRQLVALISREEALQALAAGTGTPEEVLRQETMNILQASILPGALAGIESRLSTAFGLENLTLDYLSQSQLVSVTASKRLTDRLILTYSRPVGAAASAGDAYTVTLSFAIGRGLQLTLQQQKGPYFYGARAAALPVGQPNVVETQLLLEGSRQF